MCSSRKSPPATGRPLSIAGRAAIGLIWLYRHSLSLFMGRGCRYAPSCSDYTEQAIRRFGFWAGGWIGLARILRCNPWGASGFDPLPETLPDDAHWLLPWRYGRWSGRHIPPEHRLDR
ncbi:membrane protein insertion efficiency factor YidD [Roseibium salinum]|uniref:Putative membrane protein insertion efficiency factor n=1 Tax=Roseibium salinum TaxID=1604349 RepID=A0ABT3QZN5_9HYPH|nr:membrane protein insertion efficiency factor YidD [Roseibium sp. DSM 29163]MCX2722311.1 membrane protein insertion efficiency factor YidD [Roseibium sp. DSM 29163]